MCCKLLYFLFVFGLLYLLHSNSFCSKFCQLIKWLYQNIPLCLLPLKYKKKKQKQKKKNIENGDFVASFFML